MTETSCIQMDRPGRKSIAFVVYVFSLIGIVVDAEDWPHWRGVNRNGITTEASTFSSDARSWPDGPPIWKVKAGKGAASVIIVGEKVYTIGWADGKNTLRALEAVSGELIWEQSHPAPRYGRHAVGDMGQYIGTTATPEFDPASGLIFTLSADGDLYARDTKKNGAIVWNLNLYEKYGIGQRPQITKRKNTLRDYGYTCAPLVYENWVIVEVGDTNTGNLHAFDKLTGKPAWRSENRDVAGHSGGIALMMVDGVPCASVATSYHALVVRLDGKNAGKTIAEFPWATDFSNTISGIAARENELLISSRYNQMAMVKLAVSLKDGAKEIWKNKFPTGVCTPVIHGAHIYFANKGVHCVDYETGKLIWEGGKIGDAGSCFVTADDRLIVWGNGGDLSLVETAKRSPKEFTQLALKRSVLNEKAWPHVVAANGRLYCKTTDGSLVCFSLKGEKAAKINGVEKADDLNFTAWGNDQPNDLVWSWKLGDPLVKGTRLIRRARLTARGNASISKSGAMNVSDGAYSLSGAGNALRNACQKSNAFTLEIVFQSDQEKQSGPARIVSFSKDSRNRNFTLGQEGENLIMRLRTTATGNNGSNPETNLFKIRSPGTNSVCLTYQEGRVKAYQDGKQIMKSDKVNGDFSNWAEDHGIIFGDELSGDRRDWRGSIHAVAFFSRALTDPEIAARFRLLSE